MDVDHKPQTTGRNDTNIMLALLTSVEQNHLVTQRTLASELGIALGLANSYLKRCISKGLIKISSVPPHRYAYYLTPSGFIEKSRLTSQYLQASFGFFRTARRECEIALDECVRRGCKRLVFYGVSELAEVALLCIRERTISVAGLVDPEGRSLMGLASVKTVDEIHGWDAILLTTLENPQSAFDSLTAKISPHLIIAPRMLNVSRTPPASPEGTDQLGR